MGGLFASHLPKGLEKKKVLSGLVRLNSIRNRVMHPVRHAAPTLEDFEFIQNFVQRLNVDSWAAKGSATPSHVS
jgi:hypothetical protein